MEPALSRNHLILKLCRHNDLSGLSRFAMWCFTCDVRISRGDGVRDNLLLADANTFSVARREFVFRPLRKSSRYTVIFSICASDVSHIGISITAF